MFDPTRDEGEVHDLALLPGVQLADRIVANHRAALVAETQVLELACAWADLHDRDPEAVGYQPLIERACYWGGDGTPAVSEYCAAEFGTLQRLSAMSGQMIIADALDLRHRLPRLWRAVCSGQVRAWQARKIAQATRCLSKDAAAKVDEAVSGYLPVLAWSRFQRVLGAAILDADPDLAAERAENARRQQDVFSFAGEDGLTVVIARATAGDAAWLLASVNRLADILAAEGDTDPIGPRRAKAIGLLAQPARALQLLINHQHDADPHQQPARAEGDEPEGSDRPSLCLTAPPGPLDPAAARPRVVLHFHLSEEVLRSGQGLVRPEHGEPLTLVQLREFLTRTGCAVRVQPVLDPGQVPPVDGYEIPIRMRRAVRTRQVVEVFPYGVCRSGSMDLDHTRPYASSAGSGPPGQTRVDNLGPLSRRAHRAVTHGGWRRRQPAPGQYAYRSPHGFVHLVTNQGTFDLGRGPFAARVWAAAEDERSGHPQ